MLRAYLIVSCSTVLEVVPVAILHETLPLGSHLCGGLHKIILRTEIVPVVCAVNALNVIQELFE